MRSLICFFLLLVAQFAVSNENRYEGDIVFVEGGTFTMGGMLKVIGYDVIFKEHKVELSSYYIGKYEVTNKEFCNYLNKLDKPIGELHLRSSNRGCYIKYKDGKYFVIKGYEDYPVTHVSWMGAQEFCNFYGGRLPTEAEWEYAARGGRFSKGYRYSGSNDINEVGVVSSNIGVLQPVGTLKPNELGIYDMSGNVMEFCSDWYDACYYDYSPIVNPQGPKDLIKRENKASLKVMRGSSYNNPSDLAKPFYRQEIMIDKGGTYGIGFRICFSEHKK